LHMYHQLQAGLVLLEPKNDEENLQLGL